MAEIAQLEISSPEGMHEFGIRLAKLLAAGDLVLLTGPLGAGKTTLTRGIGEGLQVRAPITSPTFVIARTHPSLVAGPALVHVDAYRLGDSTEFDDLDIDYDSSVVVAEWGSGKFVDTHDSWLELVIERPTGAELDSDESDEATEPRRITILAFGDRWLAVKPKLTELAK